MWVYKSNEYDVEYYKLWRRETERPFYNAKEPWMQRRANVCLVRMDIINWAQYIQMYWYKKREEERNKNVCFSYRFKIAIEYCAHIIHWHRIHIGTRFMRAKGQITNHFFFLRFFSLDLVLVGKISRIQLCVRTTTKMCKSTANFLKGRWERNRKDGEQKRLHKKLDRVINVNDGT